MSNYDDAFHIANEATVTLRNLADRLRSGAEPSIVAAQADSDAEMLLAALAASRG